MTENWSDIDGYEGIYKISDMGKVFSLISNKILKNKSTEKGYLYISLYKYKKMRNFYIHRLVASHFIEGDSILTVNHINGIKNDNSYKNLEWCTMGENNSHARNNGLQDRRGEKGNFTKLTEAQVICIIEALSNGEKCTHLAPVYGVTREAISRIKNGKNWKHLTKMIIYEE